MHLHALKKSHGTPNFWHRADDFKARHSQFSTCKRIGPKCNVAPVLKILGVPRLPPGGIRGTTRKGIRWNYHESSDCFEYPKKSLLKSSYPQKYLPFFKPSKNLRSSLSLEIRSTYPAGKRAYINVSFFLVHTYTLLLSTFDNLCSLFRRWSWSVLSQKGQVL